MLPAGNTICDIRPYKLKKKKVSFIRTFDLYDTNGYRNKYNIFMCSTL